LLRRSVASLAALSSSVFLLATLGCGPTFFTAKGKIASSGGALESWSVTPLGCQRTDFDGDSSKLITFMFSAPQSNDPDRDLHPDQQPNFPYMLKIAKNGTGFMGELDTKKVMDLQLDASNCKTFTLTTRSRSPGFAETHPSFDGELVLDCTVQQSHLTGDVHFKKCN
jgi:hypothetical protein